MIKNPTNDKISLIGVETINLGTGGYESEINN